MRGTDWAVLAFSAALAVSYGALGQVMAGWGVSIYALAALKASGILLLALLAAMRRRRLLMAALYLGAMGDVGLAFGGRFFLIGAGAFLLGHLCYIALFLRSDANVALALRTPWRIGAIAAVVAAAIALTLALVPQDDPLFLPLSLYTGVLALMTMTALTLPAARSLAMLGAALFFVSDGFVAANMFHPQSDPTLAFASSFTGWMLYWAGQAGLCVGMLAAPEPIAESR
ncbi:MAG: hypothetical protein GC206_10445 [Alphaproteobacteria bacterium]|nr:hypothetical protein [Alphaproteobacteria bacterium]